MSLRFRRSIITPSRDTIGIIPGDGFYDIGNASTWHDHFFINNEVKFDLTDFFTEQNKFKAGFDMNFQEMQLIDIYEPWIGVMGLNNDVYHVYPGDRFCVRGG